VTLAQELFRRLADGELHSGEALAAAAGVTRSAVWKGIGQLRDLGLAIEAQTNRGYRLVKPSEPLDAALIRNGLDKEIRPLVEVRVAWETSSTNAALLAESPVPPGAFVVLLAENQTGGRGRRGRAWRAALGDSLCVSIATSFEPLPRDLPALTLAIGACVRAALEDCGARELALKWPNDLVARDLDHGNDLRKLGGILVELRAEAGGPGYVVVGIGLNLRLGDEAREAISALGTVAGDLKSIGVDAAARNRLAAVLIDHCVRGLQQFGREGFAPFIAAWRKADVLQGTAVRVSDSSGEREGVARGIDAQGALQLEVADGRRMSIIGGEVTVRRRGE